jgi:hypothetical protein
MSPASSNALYTDPRLLTVQASRKRARTYAGEAELPGTIGSHLYHPRYGEKPLCLNLEAAKHREKSTTDKLEQPDEIIMRKTDGELNGESIRTTKDKELHAESIGTANNGEFNAEKHDDGINVENAGPFNAERHQKLTAGSKASDTLDAEQLKKEVTRASTLWFASDRCCEDELRDDIG